jgi:uncharacterized protein
MFLLLKCLYDRESLLRNRWRLAEKGGSQPHSTASLARADRGAGNSRPIATLAVLCAMMAVALTKGLLMTPPEVQPVEDAPAAAVPVRGYLHIPEASQGDALVITHGAGSNCNAPLLLALARTFCESGLIVLRCDLPFRQLQPHGPPRGSSERDQQGLRRATELVRARQGRGGRIFLSGHSYGGRQGTLLLASEPAVADGLLVLSYPLHPPKSPQQLRTAHFPRLRVPTLFVHGTHDGFGTLDEVQAALKLIPARTQLLPIDPAGHELLTSRNRANLPQLVLSAFLSFVAQI